MLKSGAYIYIIENILDGTIYVGVSNSPKRRYSEHKHAAISGNKMFHLQYAMRKHLDNIDNVFRMSIIEYFNTSDEALCQEIYWIRYLKDMGLVLYNETEGGEGQFGENNFFYGKRFVGPAHPLFGTKRPQNVLDALSKAHKGKIISEELRKRWSESHKGKGSGSQNPMYGMNGELNPNASITDSKAIDIYRMYHIDNKLIRDIVIETGISKSTIDRVVFSTGRFVWTKEIKCSIF